jgi:glycosyltransferase involved in cell wall biosynthesis
MNEENKPMKTPKLSVVIPTYNRAEMLKRLIEGMLNQTFGDFEIIVVDDGSTDETESVMKEIMNRIPQRLLYQKQENRGAGAARNLGIKHASAELVLFIDDDIMPAPNLLEEHFTSHQQHTDENVAILGSVVNAPELKVSPCMRWAQSMGPWCPQTREQNGAILNYRYFGTGNLSLKRSFMLKNGVFDENLRPFFEDIELGYRLEQRGLKIVLNKNAIGYHLHSATFETYCLRSELAGQSGALFHIKCPQADLFKPSATAGIGAALLSTTKELTMKIAIPILKPVISWLDSHDYAVPAPLYVMMQNYYSQVGYRKGIKSVEK